MRALISGAILVLLQSAYGQEWCALDVNSAVSRVQINGKPSWFISADPNGRYVGVITDNNHLYDLDASLRNADGRVVHAPMPGDVDPVFTPDGRYLTLPGGEFYDANNIRENASRGQSTANQRSIGSVGLENPYQSVGVLSSSGNSSTYMYISDSKEGDAKADLEFAITRVDHSSREMREVRRGVLCNNLEEGHTPMISNDGKYLSIMNPKTRSTQIYRVGAQGNECKKVADLGIPTGKVSFDFSSNPRKIAFHVDRHDSDLQWFSSLRSGVTKDTFVMDFNVQNEGSGNEKWDISGLQRLNVSNKPGTGTYYPRFRKDGTIVAVTVEAADRDLGNGSSESEMRYFLDVFDPSRGQTNENYDPKLLLEDCDDNIPNGAFAPLALAFLWKDACAQGSLQDRYRDSLLIAPSISPAACQQLVDRFWNTKKEAFLSSSINLDEMVREGSGYSTTTANKGTVRELFSTAALAFGPEELKASCGTPTNIAPAPITAPVLATIQNVQQRSPEQVFMGSCGGCHSNRHAEANISFVNNGEINRGNTSSVQGLNANSAIRSLRSMWDRDHRSPMPDNQELQEREKQQITEYLMGFVQGAQRTQMEQMIRTNGQAP